MRIIIIYEGTDNLVSGAFLKCFSILNNTSHNLSIVTVPETVSLSVTIN